MRLYTEPASCDRRGRTGTHSYTTKEPSVGLYQQYRNLCRLIEDPGTMTSVKARKNFHVPMEAVKVNPLDFHTLPHLASQRYKDQYAVTQDAVHPSILPIHTRGISVILCVKDFYGGHNYACPMVPLLAIIALDYEPFLPWLMEQTQNAEKRDDTAELDIAVPQKDDYGVEVLGAERPHNL
ncbi:hypothetical protein DPMN_131660 [Dreissena polymorpha]|uniref:Uncharacterized protein n=1 Tax=Dreissena polymorpha TaxID=45954 RepID=A0A9D4FSD1_DREPO|nr:hypothetical protein DPMN_131660 [Dreissena polymorpha]